MKSHIYYVYIICIVLLSSLGSAYTYDDFADGVPNWGLWKNSSSFSQSALSITESGSLFRAVGGTATGSYNVWSENFTIPDYITYINTSIQWSLGPATGGSVNGEVQIFNQTVFTRSHSDPGSSTGTTTLSLYRNRRTGLFEVNNGTAWTTNISVAGRNILFGAGCSGNTPCSWEMFLGAVTFGTYGVWNNQTSPSNNSFIISNFTLQVNNTGILEMNLTNVTYYVYRSNGTLFNKTTTAVTGKSNVSSVFFNITSTGSYRWAAYTCGTNGTFHTCYDSGNKTFRGGSFLEEFDPTVIEGQGIALSLNITFQGVDPNLLAILYWNNSLVNTSKNVINSSTIRFTTNFVVPNVGNSSGVSIPHYWRFYLPDNSINDTTDIQTQTVFSLGLDNCTTFSTLLLNYTIYDEDSRTILDGAANNASIDVNVIVQSNLDPTNSENFSRSFNGTNNAQICISSIDEGFSVYSQARYTANGYSVEYYNTQNTSLNSSNFPAHIPLYLLSVLNAQEYLITYKDSNFLPVADAIIEIQRQYLALGTFLTVEIPKTDIDGRTIGNFVSNDEVYNIYVRKNGRLLAVFENVRAFCSNVATGDCRINLDELGSTTGINSFQTSQGVRFSVNIDRDNRIFGTTFIVEDASTKTISVNVTKYDAYLNTTLCSDSLTATSGTISCTISPSYGNITVIAKVYVDGAEVSSSVFSLESDTRARFGVIRYILAFFLILSLAGMSYTSKQGMLMLFMVGILICGALVLVDLGGLFGALSAALWIIVAIIILMTQVNKEEKL